MTVMFADQTRDALDRFHMIKDGRAGAAPAGAHAVSRWEKLLNRLGRQPHSVSVRLASGLSRGGVWQRISGGSLVERGGLYRNFPSMRGSPKPGNLSWSITLGFGLGDFPEEIP